MGSMEKCWRRRGGSEEVLGEVRKDVRGVKKCERVWAVGRWKVSVEKCGETFQVSVGERCWVVVVVWDEVSGECGERCKRVCELPPHFFTHPHTLLHTSPYPNTLSPTSPQPPHSPNTLFHTYPILAHIPDSSPHPNTLADSSPTTSQSFHIPLILNPSP